MEISPRSSAIAAADRYPEGMNNIPIIINPAAGRLDSGRLRLVVEERLSNAGLAPQFFVSTNRESVRTAACQAVQAGMKTLVVIGGDGTVREAAGALAHSDTALCIIPAGTANLLALELGIPLDPVRACGLLTGPHCITSVDLGVVNGSFFAIAVGAGYGAQIMRGATRKLKGTIGPAAYIWSGLRSLVTARTARYSLKVDGELVETEALTVLVANVGRLGPSWLHIGRNISPVDGLLDLVIITPSDFTDGVRAIHNEFVHHYHPRGAVKYLKASEVVVCSNPPLPAQADGELIGHTPFTVCVAPAALHVIAPMAR